MRRRWEGAPPASVSEKEASVLVIVMVYDRQYNYHLYNSYGVLAGIGTVSLANWALPVTELGSRLSLDITLLLVSVAFKQVRVRMLLLIWLLSRQESSRTSYGFK